MSIERMSLGGAITPSNYESSATQSYLSRGYCHCPPAGVFQQQTALERVLGQVVDRLISLVEKVLDRVLGSIPAGADDAVVGLPGSAATAEATREKTGGIMDFLKPAISTIGALFKGSTVGEAGSLGSVAQGLVDKAKDWFGSLFSKAKSWISSIF